MAAVHRVPAPTRQLVAGAVLPEDLTVGCCHVDVPPPGSQFAAALKCSRQFGVVVRQLHGLERRTSRELQGTPLLQSDRLQRTTARSFERAVRVGTPTWSVDTSEGLQ